MSCAHSVFGLSPTSDHRWWISYIEELFLRCKWARAEQATDIMSSMQCSPFLSAWPTSAPEIAALRSLLPILFCYFTAPATATARDRRRKRGERGTGARCTRFTRALPLLPPLSPQTTELLRAQSSALWELSLWRTACVNNFLIMMAYPVNCSNWSEH